MILDLHGQPLHLRVVRRPLRHRPGEHDALPFEAEVVMEGRSAMLLDDEGELFGATARADLLPFRLRRHVEAALLPVLSKGPGFSIHGSPISHNRLGTARSWKCSTGRRSRLRSALRAAKYPHMPCTPPPGGVEAEQMNTLGFGVV